MSRFPLRFWYKVAPCSYIKVREGSFDSFSWAPSDGAFAHVLSQDRYFDDGATGTPPNEIIPERCGFTWQAVAQSGIQSGDRWFNERDYGSHRTIAFGRYKFSYRPAAPSSGEAPICIRVVPKVEVRLNA